VRHHHRHEIRIDVAGRRDSHIAHHSLHCRVVLDQERTLPADVCCGRYTDLRPGMSCANARNAVAAAKAIASVPAAIGAKRRIGKLIPTSLCVGSSRE
jgi:hypothetical protein